jgi:hypothetical protein
MIGAIKTKNLLCFFSSTLPGPQSSFSAEAACPLPVPVEDACPLLISAEDACPLFVSPQTAVAQSERTSHYDGWIDGKMKNISRDKS